VRPWLALLLVGACEHETAPPPVVQLDAAPAVAIAVAIGIDAAPPPLDAALVATGPCVLGQPVIFCGRRWNPDDSDIECHDPAVDDLAPLTCLPDLAYLSLRGSGVHDLRALRGRQLYGVDVGDTAITDAQALALVHGDEPHLIVSGTAPPEIRRFDCQTGEGGLRGYEAARHNVITDHLDCAAELAAGCDGTASLQLLENGRRLDVKKTPVTAAAPVTIAFKRQRPPGDAPMIYTLSVDLRCDGKRRTVSDRFATQFLWGE
jgi:hypothetical protein